MLQRKLGRLETMYHMYYNRGVDTCVQSVRLHCQSKIRAADIELAMFALMKKHPLLSMVIKEIDGQLHFVKMDPKRVDMKFSNSNQEQLLQEESNSSFYQNGPLWRISVSEATQLQTPTLDTVAGIKGTISAELPHDFCFVFSFHHSISDGMYLRLLISDFIELLYLIKKADINLQDIQERTILPPVEYFLPTRQFRKCSLVAKSCSASNCESERSIDALSAYEKHFKKEIQYCYSKGRETLANRSCMDSYRTQNFLLQCKEHRVTVTGASAAASCLSLAKMLQSSISDDVITLLVPIEIMVDMRRYILPVDDYEMLPGTAAIHLPFLVKIPIKENLHSKELFWRIAKTCTDDLHANLRSQRPITFMKKEVENEITSCPESGVGKSPYVLCLTNMSKADNLVKPDQQNYFRLSSFSGLTPIDIDNSPIFEIAVYSLASELHLDIAYSGRYTSRETGAKFSWNIMSSLQNQSTL